MTELEFPINPLRRPMDADLLRRSIVSIFDSYHAPDQDLLAEIVQNAVDALEDRAKQDRTFKPRIKLTLDTAKNQIEIVDNGIGVPYPVLQGLGTPHNTSKSKHRRRGHKGVGLTFAAWSTERFQFATLRSEWSRPEAGRLEGARQWTEKGASSCPVIEEDKPYAKALFQGEPSGAAFKFSFAPDSKVLSTVKRLRPEGLVALLKLRTALGFVNLPEVSLEGEDWVEKAIVEVWLDGDRLDFGKLGFLYPHMCIDPKYALDLASLDGLSRTTQQRLLGKKRFVYRTLKTEDLLHLLEGHEDAADLKELARKQHVAAYVAFADQKATFDYVNDRWYKDNPGPGRKTSILSPGIQIATANMPVGKPVEVSLKFGTGNKNRVFSLFEFDEIRPDFGRKTFHSDVEELAQAVASKVVTGDLVQNRVFLIPHDTPHGETPTEQEEELGQLTKLMENRPELAVRGLVMKSEPKYEQEVLGLFFALVAAGRLQGCEVLGCPGSSRKYDALVNVVLSKEDNNRMAPPLRVSPERFPSSSGTVRFSEKILEFKLSASELLLDFDADIKRPKDVFMMVCWDLGSQETFDAAGVNVVRLADHEDPIDIPGQTHLLEYNANKIHVIVLKDVITLLAASQATGKVRVSADARI